MKVALIFPPLATPMQPYSSLPALTAFIKSRKHHQVIQFDANIEFVLPMLTRRGVRAAARRISQKLGLFDSSGEYSALMSASLKAPVVAEAIEQAVADLRNREVFRDLVRLNRAKRLVHDAFEVVSASWSPISLSMTDGAGRRPCTWSELEGLAKDSARNPFRSFLEKRWFRKVLHSAAGAIGISVSFESQLLAAVTLCSIVRERLPGVPIVLGGHIISCWYDHIEECPEVFRWCDYLISFEGESALERLLCALENGEPLDGVPNLVRRERNRVIRNPSSVEDIDALPTPDYRGLPLDLYLAPEPVYLLNTSRGCYWSKCQFCSVSPSMRGNHRVRRADLVIQDIETLKARHAAQCIMFGDDCVPPKSLQALARRLTRTAPEISWQCEVRFEPALTAGLIEELALAGCRNLTFGLESYAPRILALMKKGVRHRDIRRILDDCRRFGIAFNLQLFLGFPGETEGEAHQTVEFVLEQMHGAATCSFGVFRLLRGSGVARHPDAFGIRILPSNLNALAAELDYAPLPDYAVKMKQLLRREILARTNCPYAGFSLDAHTLLFLHEAGVSRMANEYYKPPRAHEELERVPAAAARLVRKSNQTISVSAHSPKNAFLVYDYDLDEAVELSQLAVWVLQQFASSKSVDEVAHRAAQAAQNPEEAHRLSCTVKDVVAKLLKKGLVVEAVS